MSDVQVKPAIEQVVVVSNDRVAEGIGLMILTAPRTADLVAPGQFVHVRIATDTPMMLRRPFSVHRAYEDRIEVLYQVLGAGTLRLAERAPGDHMDVVGPLGHGWEIEHDATHALLVAGGLGAAPLGILAERLSERGVAVCVAQGAPTSTRLVARDVFERVARRIEIATDDGSAGEAGLVSVPVARLIAEERFDVVYACGPEAMQRAVGEMARGAGVPCQVSLERLMACGIGACLSCVVSTRSGPKRACVEGPVFDAEEVVWDASETPPKH